MTDDFYDLLGVERDATQEEIRKAFRQQVREYHPDLNDDPRAPAQFTALKKAYDTLGDPKERDDYERMGHTTYVSKRINGLPSPDEWEIPDQGNGSEPSGGDAGTAASGNGSTATGKSSNATSNAGRREHRSSNDRRSRTTTGSRNANSTGGARSATAAGTSGTSTRAGGNGTSSATGEGLGTQVRERVRWLRRVSLGWPLIILSDTLYVVGLVFYLSNNEGPVRTFLRRLLDAARGPASVTAVLGTSHGITPLSEYIVSDVTGGTTIGGPLLILGMAFIPSVYFFVIRETRQIRTPWQPTYLYVVGAVGPIVGLVVNATASPPGLYVDLACYFLLPLATVLGLPFSAFLRPKLRRAVRRTIRRYRG